MDARILAELKDKEPTKFHQDVLNLCLEHMKNSRSRMAERYTAWDRQHEIYLSRRPLDKADRQALDQGIPAKMIVPLTFAQVQTFVSFCFLLFGQNPRTFELLPTGEEDVASQEVAELALEGDLNANRWPLLLYQFLTDVAKFGLGVFKTSWRVELVDVPRQEERPVNDAVTAMQTQEVEVVAFEGNRIFNISPYQFFPDHRLPVRDFQRGEYCACAEEHTKAELQAKEADGLIVGLEFVPELDFRGDYGLDKMRFAAIDKDKPQKDLYCVTEMQLRLIPADYKLKDGRALGTSKRPKLYLVSIANDARIVRFEPVNAFHNEFTFGAQELLPDIHEKLNLGLAELIDVLQEVVGWFINSRISSVSRTIDNWLVVDPSGVDLGTIETRSRAILMKKAAARMGVDRFVKQLNVQDNTTGHIQDAQMLMQLLQTVTGVNENAMGQYNSGRRSATEARAVISGASARMRMLAQLIWTGGPAVVARQCLSNLRQSLSPEMFVRRVGPTKANLYPLFHLTPENLVKNMDYFVFDGTLPSEKSFVAQSLQELLAIVLQSPEAALQFNLDPNKLIQEIYELRGIRGLKRFGLDPAQQAQLAAASQAAVGGPEGGSSDTGVQAGNAGAA